ncbi:FAD-dependent oxidoreductase [Nodosilinea sp. LEGE 07298]|uniref:FAD-dependent oxidoreductase n=1 Tax=Nodosilinea sp. LEGE 07298 TaxID=2777970 RepID=UPI00187EBDB2|nr:FAD-dependent oxidoreductase [Nodosilinea sp. LEGE 07298]MBE9108787.1 FAD-dependent oxidoreductase [Nodosilinea sp. LEGE 07298]
MKGDRGQIQQHIRWRKRWRNLSGLAAVMFGVGAIAGLSASRWSPTPSPGAGGEIAPALKRPQIPQPMVFNGRPQVAPLPKFEDVWECQVVVVGGSLGGVAAAAHAMATGATTCLIEVAPWLGGQISAQGVSALDESLRMRQANNLSPSWQRFRQIIKQQVAELPSWSPSGTSRSVADINSCWVGTLCFPPQVGAKAAEQFLADTNPSAPASRWATMTAFKGAEFDATGRRITAVYGVRRIPKDPGYRPKGRLSEELAHWYSWSPTAEFDRIPVKLQAPPGQRMIVIDATDTGELVAWAKVPYRLGSESQATTGEPNAAAFDNPDCTQAFTYPFAIAIQNDQGDSLAALSRLQPTYALHEYESIFDLEGFPFFAGKSVFNYRRIVSQTRGNPYTSAPASGDISMMNWNRGNDWNWVDTPLVLNAAALEASGQHQNWMGGLSQSALKFGEENALTFARWLLETQSGPDYPLAYLYGNDSPMGTLSGLSMVPYFREGRRIVGRAAYGQDEFMIRENDLRYDFPGQRNFSPTAVGLTHYAIDIHGCRYRNWQPSGEAVSAPAQEPRVKPVQIPLESLIPQGIDNLLMGGKAMATTHIANASTRIHYGEWQAGAAAGVTAGWLVSPNTPVSDPAEVIPSGSMGMLQETMRLQGLKTSW